MRILCAIDDNESSRNAARIAVDLAKGLSAELILCMVNPAVLPGRGPITYLWADEYVKEIIGDFMRSARSSGLWDVRGETKRATFAADAVVNCADEWQVDYIIVGASHRSALMQVLGGSVSREIALRASCPVLIAAQAGTKSEYTKRRVE